MSATARNLIVIAAGLAVLALLAQRWVGAPHATLERFVALSTQGDYAGAALLLEAPSAFTVGADGSLTVVDRRGRTALIGPQALPFIAGQAIGAERPPNGTAEVLEQTRRGAVTALRGPDGPVTLLLTVERDRVHVESIETIR